MSLGKQLVAGVLAVYLAMGMEWLFFVTKPSFLDTMTLAQRLDVLLVSPLPLVALGAALTVVLGLVARVLPAPAGRTLGWFWPSLVLACCALLLVDNFTYSVMGVGIESTAGAARLAYAGLFAGLLAWLWRALARRAPGAASPRVWAVLAVALVAASLVDGARLYAMATDPLAGVVALPGRAANLPNIVIVGTDGVNAAHTSAYGYARDTTPFLRQLLPRALVCENALPNANSSSGSLAAMLTGRLPTRTHMFQNPDILTGTDAYLHLPGILRRLGYRAIHMGVRNYADPFQINMQNSFDRSNGRGARWPALQGRLALAYSLQLYLVGETTDRVAERLLHLTGVRPLVNPLKELRRAEGIGDEHRVTAVLDFLERTPGPVFAQLHLMGTHPPRMPRQRVFSTPRSPDRRQAKADTFDDTILAFDGRLVEIVRHLERIGKLDSTILVITSDHGPGWKFERLPLVFLFPGGHPAGRMPANAQLIDVAPTLLAYLGVPIPAWMDGASLLGEPPPSRRPIISVGVRFRAGPPFPHIGRIGAAMCDQVYWMNLPGGELSALPIPGHTAPCQTPVGRIDPTATLVTALRDGDYDVSSLVPAIARPVPLR